MHESRERTPEPLQAVCRRGISYCISLAKMIISSLLFRCSIRTPLAGRGQTKSDMTAPVAENGATECHGSACDSVIDVGVPNNHRPHTHDALRRFTRCPAMSVLLFVLQSTYLGMYCVCRMLLAT